MLLLYNSPSNHPGTALKDRRIKDTCLRFVLCARQLL